MLLAAMVVPVLVWMGAQALHPDTGDGSQVPTWLNTAGAALLAIGGVLGVIGASGVPARNVVRLAAVLGAIGGVAVLGGILLGNS